MAKEQKLTPEESQKVAEATQVPQTSPTNYNRRQRRFMLKQQGVLKYLSGLNFLGEVRSNFRQQNIENGRKIHQRNVDMAEKQIAEILEAKLESIKAVWKSIGYDKSEMDKLEEAWALSAIKDKETFKEDKRRRKQLLREVRESFSSRKK